MLCLYVLVVARAPLAYYVGVNNKGTQYSILRMTTPPPTNVADPDTPKKGKKRMAKEDLWQPTGEEIRDFIAGAKLCVKCWSVGHLCANCPEGPVSTFYPKAVLAHPEFQPFLERWREGRKKKGK